MQKLPFEIEEFSPTFKDEFYSLSKTTTYQKSTTPFSENELKNYMFIVLEGKIKTYRINLENMREQTFFIYKRGDIFDITTILDGKSHDVIYEVLEDAKTLKIPINTVKEWLKNSPEFS
ncbi:MAG: cyclic nucleotide-binding domain-containing protein, partial [Sulfurimonas sp.]